MPELHLKDIHLPDFKMPDWPELKLPEMSRDDISKALGDARKELSEVRRDLNDFRKEMEMPRVDLSKVEMPTVEMPKLEIPKEAREAASKAGRSITKAAQDVGLVKKPASRAPMLIAGAVILGLVAWALANSPSIRARLRDAVQQIRDRMESGPETWAADDEAEPHAFDGAVAASVEPSAFADTLVTADSPFSEPPSDTPEGFGQTNGTHTIESDEVETDEPARA
jgi:hypothetical protein